MKIGADAAWLRQGAYDRPRRWRVRKSGWYLPLLVLTFAGASVMLFLAAEAVYTLVGKNGARDRRFWSPMVWIDGQCSESSFSCGVLQNVFMPFLTLALVTVAYLFFRFSGCAGRI